jgi:hypothetical protein
MDVLPNTIYASDAFFAYVDLSQKLAEELRAIRHIDRRIKTAPEGRTRKLSIFGSRRGKS